MKKLTLSLFVAFVLIGRASASVIASYDFNGNASDSSGNGFNASVFGNYSYIQGGGIHIQGDTSANYSNGGYISIPLNSMGLSNGFSIIIDISNVSMFLPSNPGEIPAAVFNWGSETFGAIDMQIHLSDNGTNSYFNVQHAYSQIYGTGASTAQWQYGSEFSYFNYLPLDFWQGRHQVELNYSNQTISAYLDGVLVQSKSDTIPLPLDSTNASIGLFTLKNGNNAAMLNANIYSVKIVPEPSTYALFGLGAIGILMVMRRKKTA
jgi:PEP-CTERM motif